jgi:signal transduction histidine kinase/FixJ family two-component response regulator
MTTTLRTSSAKVRALIGALLLLFVVMTTLSINRYLDIERRLDYSISENILWAAAQNEIELSQFLQALTDAAENARPDTRSTLEKRFDILWSRVSLYHQGVLARSIANQPELKRAVSELFADLEAIEPEFQGKLEHGNLIALRQRMQAHTAPLRQITVAALASDRNERNAVAETQREIKQELSLLIGALLLLIGGVVVSLWRSEQRARRHLAESIAARKEADAAWHQLDEAIENINEGFVLYDAEDRLVRCNQKYREIYALSAAMLVPDTRFEDLIRYGVAVGQYSDAKDDPETWVQARLARRHEMDEPFEQALGDGRWLMISDRRISNGGRVGIRTDITDLKRHLADLEAAREHLRAQAERMAALAEDNQRANEVLNDAIESIGEGFVLYDARDRLVMCNARFKAFFSRVAERIEPGLSFDDFLHAAFETGHIAPCLAIEEEVSQRKLRRRSGVSASFIEALEDGRWLQVSNRLTRSGGVVTVFNDITELKNREFALIDARNDIEKQAQRMQSLMEIADAANRAKSDFLAMISHEIRTPMNAVLGLSSLLTGTTLTPEQARFVEGIEDSGTHLLGLINNILDFSRLEANKVEVRKSATDLRPMVESASRMMTVLAEKKGLTLRAAIADSVPGCLLLDGPHLNQVLINLLGNAVKFTKTGHVSLDVSCGPAATGGRELRFVIADTGIGIPPDMRASIFQPFERGRSGDRDQIAGTGLGLAITARFVRMMGGRIRLLEQIGPGAAFEVVLPAELAETSELSSAPPAEKPVHRTIRPLNILVAEDTPASQLVIRTMLEKAGHRVTMASDGQMAVDFLRREDFDLGILDIQMPHKSGIEAVAELRRFPGRRGLIPVVALSAQAFHTDRQDALEAGFDDHLAKPIRQEELHRLLHRVIDGAFARAPETFETPVSEPDMLAELEEVCGTAVFEQLLLKAVENIETEHQRMVDALKGRDFETLRRAAHKLVGVLGQYGSQRGAVAAASVETSDDDMLPGRVERLQGEIECALETLRERRKSMAMN